MDGTIGEVRYFGGNFAPRNWAICNGQLISINQNQALFSILGTTYGGDGRTTFGLPDLRGRVPVSPGKHPGSQYDWRLGQQAGTETTTLTTLQMPSHNHNATFTSSGGGSATTVKISVSSADATQTAATDGASIATPGAQSGRTFAATNGFNTSAPDTALHADTASVSGGGGGGGTVSVANNGGQQPFNNVQPILGINAIICMFGTFPSRS